jgi:hypothetical protein
MEGIHNVCIRRSLLRSRLEEREHMIPIPKTNTFMGGHESRVQFPSAYARPTHRRLTNSGSKFRYAHPAMGTTPSPLHS